MRWLFLTENVEREREVCTVLKDKISKKKYLPHIMLALGREYLEKWGRYSRFKLMGQNVKKDRHSVSVCNFVRLTESTSDPSG